MGKTIDIGGRLHSTEQGNVVAGANEIYDDTKGKKQNVINDEVDAALENLDESKQDNLTFDQTPTEDSENPVTSGGVYAADAALQQAIEAILTLIPSAASALNQLADKQFVNSSIATSTATFRGTYNLVSDLHLSVSASHEQIATALASVVSTADNQDYAFVQVPTSDTSSDIRVTERYKFNGEVWMYEYDLNNSGFTAAQWEAINSGITTLLVTKLGALPTAAELATLLFGKQNVLTFDNVPTSGSDNPVKSGGLYEKFAAIDAKIPSDADANNKLVAENRLAAYVGTIIEALDASFNLTSADGHVTFRLTQADGLITSVQIATDDIASAAALTALGDRVSTNERDIDALQDAYAALTQSDIVVVDGALPSSGQQQNIIYRQTDTDHNPPQFYSDYMWNGTMWVLMAQYNNAIDPRPKKGSQNLVTSGGVFDNMGALDVSELNATENPHTLATYADLSAALAAIPSDYQKGGMSIKFVQSSDNKYVQYRLPYQTWSTDALDWKKEEIYTINVNDINNKSDAYSSKEAARKAVPTIYQLKGIIITYLLSDGWHTEQMIADEYASLDERWIEIATQKNLTFVQSEMGIYNVSKAFPTGGTDGTNVYTKTDARAIAWNLVENISNKQGTILCYLTAQGWIFEQLKNNEWSSADSYWQQLIIVDENDYYSVYVTNIEDFNVVQRGRYVANGENNDVNDVWFRFEGTLYIHSKWNDGHLYAITKQNLIDAGVTLSQGNQMLNCEYGWQIMLNLKTGVINYFNSEGNVYRNYYTALLLAAPVRDSNGKTTLARGEIVNIYNKQLSTYIDSLKYPDFLQPNMQKVIEDKCNEIASASAPDDVIFTITSDMHGTAYEGTAPTDMCFRAVNYISQKINPLFHIDLGDSISQQLPFLNKSLGLSNFRSVCGNFRQSNKLFIVGNHDYNSYPPYYQTNPVTPQNESFIFSDKEVYNSIGRCMDGRVVWGDKNKVYYYVDYDEYKLRIICLNTTDNIVAFDENGDMTSADPMINPSIRQEQVSWFANVALDFTDKGNDKSNWKTLIFTHITPSPVADMASSPFPVNGRTKDNDLRTLYDANGVEINNNVIYDLISAFKSGGSVNYSYAGPYYIYIDGVLTPKNQFGTDANVAIQKDFSTQGAMNLISVISGHSHSQENYDYNGIAMRTIRGGSPIMADGEIPFSGDSGYAVAICRLSLSERKLYIYYVGLGKDEVIVF